MCGIIDAGARSMWRANRGEIVICVVLKILKGDIVPVVFPMVSLSQLVAGGGGGMACGEEETRGAE